MYRAKPVVELDSMFLPIEPGKSKGNKVYIPPFKRNHTKEKKAMFAKVDQSLSLHLDLHIGNQVAQWLAYVCHRCDVLGRIEIPCNTFCIVWDAIHF